MFGSLKIQINLSRELALIRFDNIGCISDSQLNIIPPLILKNLAMKL